MNFILSFLKYLEFEKRSSEHTIVSYRCDLEQFFLYLEQLGGVSLETVSRKIVRNWVVSMSESKLAPKTISRKLTALSSFFRFLMREGVVENNPTEGVPTPKIPKKLPIFVRDSEMDLLLDEIPFSDNFEGVRDRMILELFFGSGMRLSELVGLTDRSFDLREGVVRVVGKFNKERLIPLYRAEVNSLINYINVRDGEFGKDVVRSFFVTAKGENIYHKLVYRIVKKYLSLVTTLHKKSPHVLRHSFATSLLNAGADLNAIKELLGHTNLNATEVYTHNSFEKITDIYKQAHPRS